MTTVLNPFGRSLARGIDLNQMVGQDPALAEKTLASLVDETRSEMAGSREIEYRLMGAEPRYCTPMQYGGLYLERDRELLSSTRPDQRVTIRVVGGDGAYLDFVSDLPGDVFAWDCEATGFSLQQMRDLRAGTLATNDPQADIVLPSGQFSEATR